MCGEILIRVTEKNDAYKSYETGTSILQALEGISVVGEPRASAIGTGQSTGKTSAEDLLLFYFLSAAVRAVSKRLLIGKFNTSKTCLSINCWSLCTQMSSLNTIPKGLDLVSGKIQQPLL